MVAFFGFLVCMFLLWCCKLHNKVKINTINYYYDHYNQLPEQDRIRLKTQEKIIRDELFKQGMSNSNAAGKWIHEYMTRYGGTEEGVSKARSKWIMEHCATKGMECDQFVADEIAGVHDYESYCKMIEDEQKYGYAYVQRNKYKYI